METVVNNPPSTTNGDGGSGLGLVVGIIVVILIIILLVLFGLPAWRGGGPDSSPAVNVPGGEGGGTEINVPEPVDLNVNYGQ